MRAGEQEDRITVVEHFASISCEMKQFDMFAFYNVLSNQAPSMHTSQSTE